MPEPLAIEEDQQPTLRQHFLVAFTVYASRPAAQRAAIVGRPRRTARTNTEEAGAQSEAVAEGRVPLEAGDALVVRQVEIHRARKPKLMSMSVRLVGMRWGSSNTRRKEWILKFRS